MLSLIALTLIRPQATAHVYQAPAGQEFAKVVPGGQTVLPNGRFLTPLGQRLYALENVWQVLNFGRRTVIFHDDGLTVYDDPDSATKRLVSLKGVAPAGCFDNDGSRVFVSTGEKGGVAILDCATWTTQRDMSANVKGSIGSYLNDMALSADGKWLYTVDIANQDLVVFDVTKGEVSSRTKAGRQPYALTLDKRTNKVYVANIGLFDYSAIPPTTDPKWFKEGLTLPPFAFPSKEAVGGIQMEGRFVPGLGEINTPGAQSIYEYEATSSGKPVLGRTVKTGLMIRGVQQDREVVGGSSPNALITTDSFLYVSNANNDTVQQFSLKTMALARTIHLSPSKAFDRLRGVIPCGLAVTKNGKRLFVCESGLNSVAVVNTTNGRVLGRIPTGWFPMQVRLSADEKSLIVACHKGIGRGPRGSEGKRAATDERSGLPDFPGMANWIPIPEDKALKGLGETVLRNNGLVAVKVSHKPNPIPATPGKASDQIKYVVFITKENHTFDGIFGNLKGARGKPEYAEFGENGWIREKGKSERVPIMPNHIRLAEEWAISDNFYMEPQASGDGHRWLVGVYPSLWTSRVFYAGWDFKADDRNKGRMVSFGSNGSQIPEDYLENGSLWEHLERGGVTFRNYGEGFEFAGSEEPDNPERSGGIFTVNHPVTRALWNNTCFDFPIYNNAIPDIARAEWFKEDIEKNFRAKGKPLPRLINIAICNDHGASPRPDWGYPYVASYMADNDLALGRIVEYLSQQPEWKNMAVFVTQDDSGGDNDHIDRHRSFVLALGPYAKKGYVSHDHTSIMSIIKTIYQIFGLGPNNMFDAVATDLRDMFTMEPDVKPYRHVDTDHRVFKADVAYKPGDKRFDDRRWMAPTSKMDDPKFVEWLHKNMVEDDDEKPQ